MMHSEDVCMCCGGHNPTWFAPNILWNLVIGGPEARDDPGGFYCPNCFIARAEAAGIVPTVWFVSPEVANGQEDQSRKNEAPGYDAGRLRAPYD
jgi:hypothetical protein